MAIAGEMFGLRVCQLGEPVPLNPSKTFVVVLYLSIPTEGVGLCAVVPLLTSTEPVEENMVSAVNVLA